MKQKNSIALVAIRGIVSFALVFILLCSASCKKDDSTEFNKKIKPGFSEKASKSWKKGFFPEPKQSEESEEESDKTDIEERTAATGRITAKPTDETTVTTSEITTPTTQATTTAPTTQTTTTAPPTQTTTTAPPTTTASPTVNQGKFTTDQLVGEWESYVTVDYYSEISEPDVLDNIWSEEIIFATTLKHITGNKYTISLTPVRRLIDYEESDMVGMRPGPLNYQAEVNNDVLSFSLESETFAFADFYDQGFVKPLDIELLLDEGEYLFGLVYVTEEVEIEGIPSMVRVSFYISKYISTSKCVFVSC
ncbi:MAG: hypothetical protein GX217_02270 [Clostridiaceae bacterium]|nr:hypothetical protein [Clostridiaceae bacterium]